MNSKGVDWNKSVCCGLKKARILLIDACMPFLFLLLSNGAKLKIEQCEQEKQKFFGNQSIEN